MIRAYVLIETASGETKNVLKALTGALGVKSVDTVTGPYDIIAVLEDEDLNAVGKLVTQLVHGTDGIVRTATCLVVDLA